MTTTTITGTITPGVTLDNGNYSNPVTIAAGAHIGGTIAVSSTADWTVDNAGLIQGAPTTGTGVFLVTGSITNRAGGTIVAGDAGIHAYGTLALDNAGLIVGDYNRGGVLLEAGGSVTNRATGTIHGGNYGIYAHYGHGGSLSVVNAGIIQGHVFGIAGRGDYVTVENAGAISGDTRAVLLDGTIANRLIVDAGASFSGWAEANGSAANVLELSASHGAGTINGIGNDFTNFQIVTIDVGAAWDIGSIAGTPTVDNAGTVGFNSAIGIELDSSGVLINESGAAIYGASFGVKVFFSIDATIDNAGLIQATGAGGVGLYMDQGGSVTNETDGTISGAAFGLRQLLAGTIVNDGTIQATSTAGIAVALEAGGTITNTADGVITGGHYGILLQNQAGSIDNAGTISATGTDDGVGVGLGIGSVLTNEASGVITGGYAGVEVDGGGAAVNFGSIGATADDGVGVSLYNGTLLFNHGSVSGATGVYMDALGYVSNAAGAAITGGDYGVFAHNVANIVANAGTIEATAPGGTGIYLLRGGTIANAAGGTISGDDTGIFGGLSAATTLDNAGVITGTHKYGVFLIGGGSLTNQSTGTITGHYLGVLASGSNLSLGNAGTIQSSATDGVGVDVSGAHDTLVNTGVISGGTYGVVMVGDYAVLDNAGTIGAASGHAVLLNAYGTNRLILHAGAKFLGDVQAVDTSVNTVELTSGAATGTLSGLGSQYVGFDTVAIDANASWTIKGAEAGFGGVKITGFTSHDRLDLTDLDFDAGDTVSINDTTDVLTIRDGDGNVVQTIQLAGNFAGDFFHLSNDGAGHTLVTEDTTPCYCRGTRIRTPRGDRPVEDLRIGDLIVTASGDALPLKWIGRRGYRDWLAVGNMGVQPICFRAGSIADGVPARDLRVSPEHAMFLDGMLVPARHLVNGVSIVKCDSLEEIDYFHLEFDRHVIILAEGAEAESFVDDDSRMLFHNADEYRRLYPDEPRHQAAFCAPRIETGPALDTLRRTLAARARLLLPGGKAAMASPRRGCVDRATRTVIEGWAQGSVASGGGPARLAILVNGAVVGETLADQRRDDFNSSGLGDCGFRFVPPLPLSPDLTHRIEVRRTADWSLLHGGARELRPPA